LIRTPNDVNNKSVKKNFYILVSFIFLSSLSYGQAKIGDNRTSLQPGSLLELESTNKGLLNVRMTTAQMISVPVSAASRGMMVYNIDSSCLCVYDGAVWKSMCKGQASRQYKAVYTANAGDVVFNAPQIISNEQEVQVFRNGVQVNFTAAIGTNSLTLEPGAICKQDDEIKIVQIVHP
jgi:hypothetical protein